MAYLDEYSEFTLEDIEKGARLLRRDPRRKAPMFYVVSADFIIDAYTGKVVENRPLSVGGVGWQVSQ